MKKVIYLAGGCFWGVQAFFKKIRGVERVVAGYANGNTKNPAYEDLKQGKATHAETVKIEYDDALLSLKKILKYYLSIIDPKSINHQGEDYGLQYRTGIYYFHPEDKIIIDKVINKADKDKDFKIEIDEIKNFYPAEEYHQDYIEKNGTEENIHSLCHVNLQSVKKYDLKDDNISLKFPNKSFLLIGLLLGFASILLGETIHILPLVFIGDLYSSDNYIDKLYELDGFANLASKILVLGLLIIFFVNIFKKDFKKLKNKWYFYLIYVIVGFGIIYGLGYVFDILYTACGVTDDANNQEQIIIMLGGRGYYPLALSIAIFTPIVEEFVFRKLMYSTLKYFKCPKWLNIIITMFIFALVHCLSENPFDPISYLYLLNYLSLSAVITGVYVLSDENIYASTLVHMLNNTLSLILI